MSGEPKVFARLVSRIRRGRGDQGFSLPELLVSMVVSSIVIAGLATIFEADVRTSAVTSTRLDQTNDARVAVEAMSRNLRAAVMPSQLLDTTNIDNAFISGGPTWVTFYADLDNAAGNVGPSRVTICLVGGGSSCAGGTAGQLVETIQRPNNPPPADPQYCTPGPLCPVNMRVLASGVLSSTPIFKYYDSLGNPLSGVLAAADLANVDSMSIDISVQRTNAFGALGKVAPSEYVDVVQMPNHDSVAAVTN